MNRILSHSINQRISRLPVPPPLIPSHPVSSLSFCPSPSSDPASSCLHTTTVYTAENITKSLSDPFPCYQPGLPKLSVPTPPGRQNIPGPPLPSDSGPTDSARPPKKKTSFFVVSCRSRLRRARRLSWCNIITQHVSSEICPASRTNYRNTIHRSLLFAYRREDSLLACPTRPPLSMTCLQSYRVLPSFNNSYQPLFCLTPSHSFPSVPASTCSLTTFCPAPSSRNSANSCIDAVQFHQPEISQRPVLPLPPPLPLLIPLHPIPKPSHHEASDVCPAQSSLRQCGHIHLSISHAVNQKHSNRTGKSKHMRASQTIR